MSFEKPWGNYLLEAIVETKAPDTVSFWPQTIAWQLLFILLILLIIKKSYQSWKDYQANAYRREALTWLAQCSLSNEEDIRQLPALLRKTAILASQKLINENSTITDNINLKTYALKCRQEITALSGKNWAEWLDEHCDKSDFTEKKSHTSSSPFSCELLLAQLAYAPKIDITDNQFNEGLIQLTQQIKLWITYHEVSHELSSEPESEPKYKSKPKQKSSGATA
jgi:hypothetical protein